MDLDDQVVDHDDQLGVSVGAAGRQVVFVHDEDIVIVALTT